MLSAASSSATILPSTSAETRISKLRLGQHHVDRSFVDDEADALVWIARLERDVCAASLEAGENGHDRQLGALQAQPYERAWADTQPAQVMRQAIGPRIELPIRQRKIAAHERRCARPSIGLGFKQLLEARLCASPSPA